MTFTFDDLIRQLSSASMEKNLLLSASFELTSRCNQKCNMCYICFAANDREVKAKELTTAHWLRLAEEARDAGLFMLTLTGGEVFLREDFREIYEGIMQLGLLVGILTNGTMITPETIKWLEKIPPNKVGVTLYGASRETCARVTGYDDSYDRTVRAIDGLLDAGINVEIRTTVTRDNMQDFDRLFKFAQERERSLGVVTYVSPRREGCNSYPLENRLSSDELVQYEQIMYSQARPKREKNRVVKEDSGADSLIVNSDNASDNNNKQKGAFRCSAGKSGAWVTWDGKMLACALMNTPATYPLQQGFSKAWADLQHQCSLVPVCTECVSCQYYNLCETCPARLKNETGSFVKPAPYLCETVRRRIEIIQDNAV